VIILNWDDHFLSDFLADYVAAIPALEAYISGGGVVWVQGAIQGGDGEGEDNSYPLPFGGQSNFDLSTSDPIVDPSNPMVAGVPSPITGNSASHVSDEDLPGDADIVVVKGEDNQRVNGEDQSPVLYDLFRGTSCVPTPTPTPSPTATETETPKATETPEPTETPKATETPEPSPTATETEAPN
jgi:hypothetical protein